MTSGPVVSWQVQNSGFRGPFISGWRGEDCDLSVSQPAADTELKGCRGRRKKNSLHFHFDGNLLKKKKSGCGKVGWKQEFVTGFGRLNLG